MRTLSVAGTHDEALQQLHRIAAAGGGSVEVDEHRIPRSWVLRRGESYPVWEWFDVVAPTTARDKVRPGFTGAWRTLGLGTEQLALTES